MKQVGSLAMHELGLDGARIRSFREHAEYILKDIFNLPGKLPAKTADRIPVRQIAAKLCAESRITLQQRRDVRGIEDAFDIAIGDYAEHFLEGQTKLRSVLGGERRIFLHRLGCGSLDELRLAHVVKSFAAGGSFRGELVKVKAVVF